MVIVGSTLYKINTDHSRKKWVLPRGLRLIRAIPFNTEEFCWPDQGVDGGGKEECMDSLSSGNSLLKSLGSG